MTFHCSISCQNINISLSVFPSCSYSFSPSLSTLSWGHFSTLPCKKKKPLRVVLTTSQQPPEITGPNISQKHSACSRVYLHPRKWKWSRSVMSDSLWSRGLQPTRLLCPWDSPGKNNGVGCHFLLQGIFLTQGSNPTLLWVALESLRLNELNLERVGPKGIFVG